MIYNNVANCQYAGLWMSKLGSELGYKFVNDRTFGQSCSVLEALDLVSQGEKLLLYWRWAYSDMTEDKALALKQQDQLLSGMTTKTAKQYIILDGDHMLPGVKAIELQNYGATIARPELSSSSRIMYPYFASLERKVLHNPQPKAIYVGTPLDREQQVSRYLSKTCVDFWGSWQGKTKNSLHKANGKLDNCEVLNELSGRATLILAKQSYYSLGYITPRWYECAYSGCAVAIPDEYACWMPDYMLKWCVTDSFDTSSLLTQLLFCPDTYAQNVYDLRKFCHSISDYDIWSGWSKQSY